MKNRKGFTLIELLVVAGILVLLIGILLPVVSKVHRNARLSAQRLDFQAISTALENYRQDFRDYPRNPSFPIWNSNNNVNPAPVYWSLGPALLGSGPGTTQTVPPVTGILQAGDGADGSGFRSQSDVYAQTAMQVSSGQTTLSATNLPQNWSVLPPAQLKDSLAVSSVVFSPGITSGSSQEESVGISSVSGGAVTFLQPPMRNHPATDPPPAIKVATGKVWANYLPVESFKVQFMIPSTGLPAYPVLLDRFGGVIQYFPKNGKSTNRTNPTDSVDGTGAAADPSVIVGPLWGISTNRQIDSILGEFAIWDYRDGIPVNTPAGSFNWLPYSSTTNPNGTLSVTVRWMLGDEPTSAFYPFQDNFIKAGETLRWDGDFILISAGPDGNFCNLINVTPDKWKKAFQDSGNVYNFDR